jgi:hypothetical protein
VAPLFQPPKDVAEAVESLRFSPVVESKEELPDEVSDSSAVFLRLHQIFDFSR